MSGIYRCCALHFISKLASLPGKSVNVLKNQHRRKALDSRVENVWNRTALAFTLFLSGIIMKYCACLRASMNTLLWLALMNSRLRVLDRIDHSQQLPYSRLFYSFSLSPHLLFAKANKWSKHLCAHKHVDTDGVLTLCDICVFTSNYKTKKDMEKTKREQFRHCVLCVKEKKQEESRPRHFMHTQKKIVHVIIIHLVLSTSPNSFFFLRKKIACVAGAREVDALSSFSHCSFMMMTMILMMIMIAERERKTR